MIAKFAAPGTVLSGLRRRSIIAGSRAANVSSFKGKRLLLGGFAMKRYGLRDDQFARIENLLPGRPGTVGSNSDRGNRLFVEAVIWKFRAGAPWRDLPERFGGWSNTHRRFSRWAGRLGESLSRPWP